jgi:archaellum biogenesis protein FlaJ (TadC family)
MLWKKVLRSIVLALIFPVSFAAFMMWMLGVEVSELTEKMVVLVIVFWLLVAYVSTAYNQLKHDFPEEYKHDTYARRRARIDGVLGAGVIGLLFLLAQSVFSSH